MVLFLTTGPSRPTGFISSTTGDTSVTRAVRMGKISSNAEDYTQPLPSPLDMALNPEVKPTIGWIVLGVMKTTYTLCNISLPY